MMGALAAFVVGLSLVQAPISAIPSQAQDPRASVQAVDSLPTVTLREALQRATRLDPNYVAATRQVTDAQWSRRAALSVFVVPSISAQISGTRFSNQQFNVGTGQAVSEIWDARLQGRLNLFSGLGKFNEARRAGAALDAARAGEVEARYLSALFTEADFFDVLAQRELLRVARERVVRVREQLGVARARVLTGAAVQTDSLQLLLEVTEAEVGLIRQEARLKVARFQLGRRIGIDGPVDALASSGLLNRDLPHGQEQLIAEALDSSPSVLVARAQERAAEAAVRVQKGSYLPSVDLVGQVSVFDQSFWPTALSRNSVGLVFSLPIWNDAQREIAVSRASTAREIARASREDVERALRRDVVEAHEAYEAARAQLVLADRALTVARENLRVQQERYRAGATSILDLLTADGRLSDAEAGLVQAQFSTRLALTGLEAILGRRLYPVSDSESGP
jgi:outer membrane protein TolC